VPYLGAIYRCICDQSGANYAQVAQIIYAKVENHTPCHRLRGVSYEKRNCKRIARDFNYQAVRFGYRLGLTPLDTA